MSDDFEERLRRAARALPREIAPRKSAWPEIRNRVERRPSSWPFLAAAAVVLTAGVVASTGRHEADVHAPSSAEMQAIPVAAPAPLPASLLPHEPEMRLAVAQLRGVYEQHRIGLDPAIAKLFDDQMAAVAEAVESSRQALALRPEDPHLKTMLDHAYDHQLQLFKHAAATKGTN